MIKKIILIVCLLTALSNVSAGDTGDIVGGLLNAGIATWGYVEASKHKEVRVYINVTATIFAIRSLVYFIKATQ